MTIGYGLVTIDRHCGYCQCFKFTWCNMDPLWSINPVQQHCTINALAEHSTSSVHVNGVVQYMSQIASQITPYSTVVPMICQIYKLLFWCPALNFGSGWERPVWTGEVLKFCYRFATSMSSRCYFSLSNWSFWDLKLMLQYQNTDTRWLNKICHC